MVGPFWPVLSDHLEHQGPVKAPLAGCRRLRFSYLMDMQSCRAALSSMDLRCGGDEQGL